MKAAAVSTAFLVAFVLAMCGGPQFVADLLNPSLGQVGFWVAFTPLLVAGVGACYFMELLPVPAGWGRHRFPWGSFTVRAGVWGMLLLTAMNAFTLVHLAIVPGHPNQSLVVFGSIVGLPLAAAYVLLARQYQRLPLETDHRTAWCSAPRLTAQLVLSGSRAYLGYSAYRRPPGPNGESRIAFILQTEDAGASWTQMPWRRSIWSSVRHPLATWPPEDIVSMAHTPQGLRVTHRDEEVMFEPGGEALWQSRFVDGKWSLRRLRAMDYKRTDSPNPLPELPRELPLGMQPPQFGSVAIIVESWTLTF
jgi:hypothetical protein